MTFITTRDRLGTPIPVISDPNPSFISTDSFPIEIQFRRIGYGGAGGSYGGAGGYGSSAQGYSSGGTSPFPHVPGVSDCEPAAKISN